MSQTNEEDKRPDLMISTIWKSEEESRTRKLQDEPLHKNTSRAIMRGGQTRMMGTDSELPDLKGRFARWIRWMRAGVIVFRSNGNSLTS